MSESKFYEYAIIRVVPRVEREEFINVGIILFSKSGRFLKAKIALDQKRLATYNHELDVAELELNLVSFHKICQGSGDSGPIGKEDMASRFRWLTAVRSSSIQTSRPHIGSGENLDEILERLFQELVK